MKKLTFKHKILSLFVALIITFSFLPATPVHAATNTTSVETFAATLKKTDSSQLVGVFVKNVMAVKVVQQSSAAYVSSSAGTVTQFGMASQAGSIGLLAHNYLSGGSFSKLGSGTEIILVYGDGSTKKYQVTSVKKYQALSPTDPYSNFVNLDNPDTTLSSSDVFYETYGSGALVLQTCISKNGNSSWGRLFII
ncbi:MAG: sortase, partial [Anaerolineaceae bacterium]|nr:sortase [Anaerolineaceae bacterium]